MYFFYRPPLVSVDRNAHTQRQHHSQDTHTQKHAHASCACLSSLSFESDAAEHRCTVCVIDFPTGSQQGHSISLSRFKRRTPRWCTCVISFRITLKQQKQQSDTLPVIGYQLCFMDYQLWLKIWVNGFISHGLWVIIYGLSVMAEGVGYSNGLDQTIFASWTHFPHSLKGKM